MSQLHLQLRFSGTLAALEGEKGEKMISYAEKSSELVLRYEERRFALGAVLMTRWGRRGGMDTPFHRNFGRLVLSCVEADFLQLNASI